MSGERFECLKFTYCIISSITMEKSKKKKKNATERKRQREHRLFGYVIKNVSNMNNEQSFV